MITLLFCRDYTRQKPIYPLDPSIQSKLSKKEKLTHPLIMIELPIIDQSEQSNRHWEIKTCSDFFEMTRRKIQHKFPLWKIYSDVSKTSPNPLFGFLNTRIGQANNLNIWQSSITISLYKNLIAQKSNSSECFDMRCH